MATPARNQVIRFLTRNLDCWGKNVISKKLDTQNYAKKNGPWDHRLHKVILALGRGLMESPNMDFYLRHKLHFVLLLRCAAQVPKSDFDIESSLKGLASGPQKSKIEGQKFCLGFRCSLKCQSDLWRHFVCPPLSGKKNLRMYAAV